MAVPLSTSQTTINMSLDVFFLKQKQMSPLPTCLPTPLIKDLGGVFLFSEQQPTTLYVCENF